MSDFQLGPNQTRWLEALESDQYCQTRGKLTRQEVNPDQTLRWCHCCLGVAKVACNLREGSPDLLFQSYPDMGLHEAEGSVRLEFWADRARREAFTERVRTLGVGKRPLLPLVPEDFALVRLNDVMRLSFREIAAVLREFPEAYFVEAR